jgi:hypothetical protein
MPSAAYSKSLAMRDGNPMPHIMAGWVERGCVVMVVVVGDKGGW